MTTESYGYVAYIDEAGDPGLTRVKPIDIPGSSEWLILSALVIGAPNEANVVPWVREIIGKFKNYQRRDLHFTNLPPHRRKIVCSEIATLPVRCFVVCSNKKNMKGYRNPFAEKYPSPNWFYAWMSRLLLERVTHFVHAKSIEQHREIKKVRLEFSERGGLTHASLNTYFEWLKMKSTGGDMFIPFGDLKWETMHRDLLHIYPHKKRAGLQLADSIASAFFKACDCYDTGACDPEFARLLAPRMARVPDATSGGQISGYGVKLMPAFKKANLLPEQAAIFTHYGYPRQWWDPASISTGG
jgi:Protein of unknown function (DUF3800)